MVRPAPRPTRPTLSPSGSASLPRLSRLRMTHTAQRASTGCVAVGKQGTLPHTPARARSLQGLEPPTVAATLRSHQRCPAALSRGHCRSRRGSHGAPHPRAPMPRAAARGAAGGKGQYHMKGDRPAGQPHGCDVAMLGRNQWGWHQVAIKTALTPSSKTLFEAARANLQACANGGGEQRDGSRSDQRHCCALHQPPQQAGAALPPQQRFALEQVEAAAQQAAASAGQDEEG